MSNRRRLENLVQKPGVQYQQAVYFFGCTVVGVVLVQSFLVGSLQRFIIETMLASGADPMRLQAALQDQLQAYTLRITLLFPVLGLAATFLALRITHRFLGPQVAIRRHVRALANDDFSSRLHLRKRDELQELAADLNDLAAVLADKYGAEAERRAA